MATNRRPKERLSDDLRKPGGEPPNKTPGTGDTEEAAARPIDPSQDLQSCRDQEPHEKLIQWQGPRTPQSSRASPTNEGLIEFLKGVGTEIMAPSAGPRAGGARDALCSMRRALVDIGFRRERINQLLQPLIEGAAVLDPGDNGRWRSGFLEGHVVLSLTVLDDNCRGQRQGACRSTLEKVNDMFNANAKMIISGGVSSVVVSEAISHAA